MQYLLISSRDTHKSQLQKNGPHYNTGSPAPKSINQETYQESLLCRSRSTAGVWFHTLAIHLHHSLLLTGHNLGEWL